MSRNIHATAPEDLKTRIERVLSEILSDAHGCKITLHFEKHQEDKKA